MEQHRATDPGAPCLASETWVRSGGNSPPGVLSFPLRLFRIILAASLTLSALLYFLWSWHWPLVGDASLIHYIAFLIERGWAPYRDLGDMNMPGSYLIELAAMHLLGPGALAWRLFDFTLLAAATAAFFSIVTNAGAPLFPVPSERVGSASPQRPGAPSMTVSSSWVGFEAGPLAALFASSLFLLIHGRDGLAQGGQRDLSMAVCLIAATAFLFHAVRKNVAWPAAAFGLLSGVAVTIKPTAILLTLAQLALALYVIPRTSRRKLLAASALAYLVAPAAVLIFLLREHSLSAFLAALRTIVPYYAGLGHRPLGYVLLHSLSPLLALVLLWLAVLALDRDLFRSTLNWTRDWPRHWERAALLAGVLFGLVNCVLQARALPYYRYPLLAFLLPLMALDFTRAIEPANESGGPSFAVISQRVGSSQAARLLAHAALIVGGFFLAPQSAILIHRYRWRQTDLIASLEQNLSTLGGTQLSGHIQCIDTNSGCGNVLYLMRLEPATGILSDFFLFDSPQSPAVRQTRDQFSAAILAHPPQVIVVTSRLYLADPGDYDNYAKLDRWPAFQSFLTDRYTLQTEWTPTRTERWWSREEYPAAYRIYLLRPDTSVQATEQRGTVIVVSQSKNRVIMAADSRVGLTNDGINIHGVDDGKCKLASLDGNLIFGASGLIGNSAMGWSAASIAMDTATAATPPTDRDKGRQILAAWSESMIRRVVLDFTPEQIRTTARQNEGGLTTGILAGIGPEGTAWAQVSQIRYAVSDIRQLRYEIGSPISVKRQAFYFFGKTEIADEFNAGISDRSKREVAQWSRMRLGNTAFDEFKARRLAELTIQLYPDKTAVGGPVDEVELDSEGSRWITLKKNCISGDAGRPTQNSH